MDSPYYGTIGALLAMGLILVIYRAVSRRRNERHGPPVASAVEVPQGHGTVTVRRPHANLSGAARALTVVVDGVPRGKVKAGAAMAVAVPPGMHSLNVALGRKSSAALTFQTEPGSVALFETEILPGAFTNTFDLRPVSA